MMMRLFYSDMSIKIQKETVTSFEIENIALYRSIQESLFQTIQRVEDIKEPMHFYDQNDEEINLNKDVLWIDSPFTVNWNEKRIFADLLTHYEARSDSVINLLEQINQTLNLLKISFLDEIDCELQTKEDFQLDELMKVLKIKLTPPTDFSIYDRLLFILDILATSQTYKLIIISHIGDLLSVEEKKKVYEYVQYRNLRVLLIVNGLTTNKLSDEKIYQIDSSFIEHEW